MTYAETLDYLYARLPMFTRIGAAAIKKDLTNTLFLCERAGNPQRKFRSIHVAGTNGKGSVSHMLASILQEAGYKTGLYTSPHLQDFRERIRVNGAMIPEEEVIRFTEMFSPSFEEIEPSFFEVTVAMAFQYFAQCGVDVAVIETGLGGRLDSTNVITPELSIITNIGMDHVQLLGNTLGEIAGEKAGIIKENIPVVIGETHPETVGVFTDKAKEKKAPIVFADAVLRAVRIASSPSVLTVAYEAKGSMTGAWFMAANQAQGDMPASISHATGDNVYIYTTDLPGRYQAKNMATVLTALSLLNAEFPALDEAAVRRGLQSVKKNTGLMGRWEVLQENPLLVLDVGHNEDGMRQVLEQLRHQSYRALHIVIGMVRDKDIEKVLAMLPADAHYYFTNAAIPRALPADELAARAGAYGLKGTVIIPVKDAVKKALDQADKNDLVLVCGSVFVVGEVERGSVAPGSLPAPEN